MATFFLIATGKGNGQKGKFASPENEGKGTLDPVLTQHMLTVTFPPETVEGTSSGCTAQARGLTRGLRRHGTISLFVREREVHENVSKVIFLPSVLIFAFPPTTDTSKQLGMS